MRGSGRRWLVGYRRPSATIDPCGFRQLVLATMRGCRVGILPADRVEFVGGMREVGAGVLQRHGDHGPERRLATFLPPAQVAAILAAGECTAGDSVTAHLTCDTDLAVTVVTLATTHPA